MKEIFRDVVSGRDGRAGKPSSRAASRRRMELRQMKLVSGEPVIDTENGIKRQKLVLQKLPVARGCGDAVEDDAAGDGERLWEVENEQTDAVKEKKISDDPTSLLTSAPLTRTGSQEVHPKYGKASVCGRRRDMEDAVAMQPSFCLMEHGTETQLHYFGVYDGHGCSHVATRCRDRLHELVREELEKKEGCTEWGNAMKRSFSKMDKEVATWKEESSGGASCRCELQPPESDAVGSTAVAAIVTSDKIIVANCGDSRAVLCRGGRAIPLSTDHKPDRPDELSRIQAAGGRVIYWDGPRVLGVLATSRAIGDNYLKPYVSCEPEVTETSRMADDECLILATDGLWDVVSNETACSVARMCLRRGRTRPRVSDDICSGDEREAGGRGKADKACSDASMLLTKLALARRSIDNVSVVVIDLRADT